jgi:hypothetical protein
MELKIENLYQRRGSMTGQQVQESINAWVSAGWTLDNYSTCIDGIGGLMHSFIWRKD